MSSSSNVTSSIYNGILSLFNSNVTPADRKFLDAKDRAMKGDPTAIEELVKIIKEEKREEAISVLFEISKYMLDPEKYMQVTSYPSTYGAIGALALQALKEFKIGFIGYDLKVIQKIDTFLFTFNNLAKNLPKNLHPDFLIFLFSEICWKDSIYSTSTEHYKKTDNSVFEIMNSLSDGSLAPEFLRRARIGKEKMQQAFKAWTNSSVGHALIMQHLWQHPTKNDDLGSHLIDQADFLKWGIQFYGKNWVKEFERVIESGGMSTGLYRLGIQTKISENHIDHVELHRYETRTSPYLYFQLPANHSSLNIESIGIVNDEIDLLKRQANKGKHNAITKIANIIKYSLEYKRMENLLSFEESVSILTDSVRNNITDRFTRINTHSWLSHFSEIDLNKYTNQEDKKHAMRLKECASQALEALAFEGITRETLVKNWKSPSAPILTSSIGINQPLPPSTTIISSSTSSTPVIIQPSSSLSISSSSGSTTTTTTTSSSVASLSSISTKDELIPNHSLNLQQAILASAQLVPITSQLQLVAQNANKLHELAKIAPELHETAEGWMHHKEALERIFEREAELISQEAIQGEIESNPVLRMYYFYLMKHLTSYVMACQVISSRKVALSDETLLQYGGHVLKAFGSVGSAIDSMISFKEVRKQMPAMDQIALRFADPIQGTKLLVELARKLTLRRKEKLMEIAKRPVGVFTEVWERMKSKYNRLVGNSSDRESTSLAQGTKNTYHSVKDWVANNDENITAGENIPIIKQIREDCDAIFKHTAELSRSQVEQGNPKIDDLVNLLSPLASASNAPNSSVPTVQPDSVSSSSSSSSSSVTVSLDDFRALQQRLAQLEQSLVQANKQIKDLTARSSPDDVSVGNGTQAQVLASRHGGSSGDGQFTAMQKETAENTRRTAHLGTQIAMMNERINPLERQADKNDKKKDKCVIM